MEMPQYLKMVRPMPKPRPGARPGGIPGQPVTGLPRIPGQPATGPQTPNIDRVVDPRPVKPTNPGAGPYASMGSRPAGPQYPDIRRPIDPNPPMKPPRPSLNTTGGFGGVDPGSVPSVGEISNPVWTGVPGMNPAAAGPPAGDVTAGTYTGVPGMNPVAPGGSPWHPQDPGQTNGPSMGAFDPSGFDQRMRGGFGQLPSYGDDGSPSNPDFGEVANYGNRPSNVLRAMGRGSMPRYRERLLSEEPWSMYAEGGRVEAAAIGPYAVPPKAGVSRGTPMEVAPMGGLQTPTGYLPALNPMMPPQQAVAPRLEDRAPESLAPTVAPRLGTGRRMILTPEGRDNIQGYLGQPERRRPSNLRRFADGGRIPHTMMSPFEGSEAVLDVMEIGTKLPTMFEGEEEISQGWDGAEFYKNGGRVKQYAQGGRVPEQSKSGGKDPWGTFGYRTRGRTDPVQVFGGGDAGEQAGGYQFTYDDPRVRNLDAVVAGGWGGGGGGMAQDWDLYTDPATGQEFYRIGDYDPNDDSQRRHGVNFDPSSVTYNEEMGRLLPRDAVNFDTSDYGISSTMGWAVPAVIGGAALFGGAGPFSGAEGAGAGGGVGEGFGGAEGLGLDPYEVDMAAGSVSGGGTPAGLGIDPYEVDMAPGSVSTNQPGMLEQGQNWARENLGIDRVRPGERTLTDRLTDAATRDPMQTGRLVASVLGGIGAGGGSTTGTGPTAPYTGDTYTDPGYKPPASTPVARPEYGDYSDYLAGGGSSSGQANFNTPNISVAMTGGPYKDLEKQMFEKLKEIGGPGYEEQRASEGIADAANTFEAQRGAALRDAQRRGVAMRPEQMARMRGDEAAARALMANKGRQAARDEVFTKVAPIVENYADRDARLAAAGAAAAGQTASASFNALSARENRDAQLGYNRMIDDRNRQDRRYEFDTGLNTQRERAARGDYESDRGFGFNRERAARGDFNQDRSYDAGERQAADTRRRNNLAGVGSIIGSPIGTSIIRGIGSAFGFAEGGRIIDGHATRVPDAEPGGRVDGPGHETSDSVPARLSKGEMVINTDSVREIDKHSPGLLDRMNNIGLVIRAMGMGVMKPPKFETATNGIRG